jgi:hypothetical protein
MLRLLKLVLVAGVLGAAGFAAYRLLAGRPLDHPVAEGRHTAPAAPDPTPAPDEG